MQYTVQSWLEWIDEQKRNQVNRPFKEKCDAPAAVGFCPNSKGHP